jgi:hypothetical protein
MNCETGGDSFNLKHWDAPAAEQPFLNTFNNNKHNCPGQSLSLLEAHVFLLMAATKFHFAFPNGDETRGMEFMDHVVLQPANGMPLIVTERWLRFRFLWSGQIGLEIFQLLYFLPQEKLLFTISGPILCVRGVEVAR